MAGRTNPTPEARGGGREDQPNVQGALAVQAQEGLEELSHVRGAVAARAQEDLEELFHVEGQEGRQ